MTALLAGAAFAASCCSSTGASPASLASCDAVGLTLGARGQVETGGWSWDGRWFLAGDDGGAEAMASVAVVGRLAPFVQLGARVPLALTVDRVDGVVTPGLGLGDALAWVGLEAGGDHARVVFDLGGGLADFPDAGRALAHVGARGRLDGGAWRGWGALATRLPLDGRAPVDGTVDLVVDRALGPRARLGFGLGAEATGGAVPGFGVSAGPVLHFTPSDRDQLLLSLRAGLPVPGLGRSTSSAVALTLDWYVGIVRVE